MLSHVSPPPQVLVWDIGKLNQQKLPNLKGGLSLQSGSPKPEENPSLNIDLKIQQLAISGETDKSGREGQPWPIITSHDQSRLCKSWVRPIRSEIGVKAAYQKQERRQECTAHRCSTWAFNPE